MRNENWGFDEEQMRAIYQNPTVREQAEDFTTGSRQTLKLDTSFLLRDAHQQKPADAFLGIRVSEKGGGLAYASEITTRCGGFTLVVLFCFFLHYL